MTTTGETRTNQATVASESPEYRGKRRKAISGAIFGFFVDMYDVYLPTIIMAPAMVYFLPDDASVANTTLWFSAVFVATILGRPLGSVIFGPLSDHFGRRRVTLIAAGGSAICTTLMTVMPGYASLGIVAVLLLILLRLINGAFLAGQYSGANTLAMEYAPKRHRGLVGSLINMGYPLSLTVMTVISLILVAFLPPEGPDSAYAVWGWRIPFAVGAILCTILFFYYLLSVSESEVWERSKTEKTDGSAPKRRHALRELFSMRNARALTATMLFGTGAWLSMQATVGLFSPHFRDIGVPDARITTTLLLGASLAAMLFPVMGVLGQRLGRKSMIVMIGLAIGIITPTGFAIAVMNADNSILFMTGGIMAITPAALPWSLITAFLTEQFPTDVRAGGYAIAYTVPSILPSFYATGLLLIANWVPYDIAPTVFLVLAGLLVVAGGILALDRQSTSLERVPASNVATQ